MRQFQQQNVYNEIAGAEWSKAQQNHTGGKTNKQATGKNQTKIKTIKQKSK